MGLPARVYWTLPEAASRWGCAPADIAGWAADGTIEIVTGLPPLRAGGKTLGGFLVVPAADIIAMFRRFGGGPAEAVIRRVREMGSADWLMIEDPAAGITIHALDLLILSRELDRFEESCGLKTRPKPIQPPPGPSSKWDWDGFYRAMFRRVHERGMPPQQQDLIVEMRDWFEANSPDGSAPDESTIRRKVQPIWRDLRGG